MEKSSRKEKKAGVVGNFPLERQFSAGGVVYKKGNPEKYLLIRPAGTQRWQLPKGRIDPGESSLQTAIREVEEEGCVIVRSVKKIGPEQYFFIQEGKKIIKTVTFYLMEYLKDSKMQMDKTEIAEIRFVDRDDVFHLLTFKNDRKIFEKAIEILSSASDKNLL